MNIKQVSCLIAVLLLLPLATPLFAHEHHHAALAAEAPSSDSIFNLKSPWTDQNGKAISLSVLKGKPALLAMIYTTCDSACPLLVEDIKKIESLLPEADRDKVHFALFSFDPDRDTTERLKRYAEVHGLGKDWILARGPAKSVRELAAALGVQYKKSGAGDFQHSNLITVLDKGGVIKKQQSGLGKSGEESAAEVAKLLGKRP